MELARRYCGPPRRGIEIGASAANPFPGVVAWNLDLPDADLFVRAQQARVGAVAPLDVAGAAQALPVRDGSVDFLLASHVLEHMPDTLRALREWDRVVRPGGVVFLIVPHRERTFDRTRRRTELEHHLADYAERASVASSTLVPTSHYHVWITADLVALVEHLDDVGFLDWSVEAVEDVDSKVGNGFTLVARKRSRTRVAAEPDGAAIAFHHLILDLPFQAAGRDLEFIAHGEELRVPQDVPRGCYHCVPIRAGFPPVAGERFSVEVGEPLPPPVLEATEILDGELRLSGRHFAPTTWLEGRAPDGRVLRVLPELRDGRLVVPLEGLAFPAGSLPVAAVNPPPGGGRGPEIGVRLRA